MRDGAGLGSIGGLYPGWIAIPVLAAGLCALAYLLVYCYRDPSPAKSAVKTASVGLLAIAALFTVSSGPLLALALGLCAAGDFFLSRQGDRAFLAGVASFAAGHVAYIVLFVTHPLADPAALARSDVLLAAALLAVFGLGMIAVLFPRTGPLRWAVAAYVPVIVAMAVTSVAATGMGWRALALPAALSFMLSDTVLSAEMFLLRDGHPLRRVTPFIVWSFYWLAQLGFFVALGWGVVK